MTDAQIERLISALEAIAEALIDLKGTSQSPNVLHCETFHHFEHTLDASVRATVIPE